MLKNKKAFSIAEAMITLTITAVLAAAAAPLVSKQLKNNTLSDIAFSALNQKYNSHEKLIEDLEENFEKLEKTKWSLTSGESGVTRPKGLVGIGLSETQRPSAKLHVAVSEDTRDSEYALLVSKTVQGEDGKSVTKWPFTVANDGIVSVRSLNADEHTKFRVIDDKGTIRVSVDNNGVLKVDPNSEWTAFQVNNINKNVYNKKSESQRYVAYPNSDGTLNKVWHSQGFSVLSHGGVRINYEEIKSADGYKKDGVSVDNSSAGGPLVIYVDGGRRFAINEAGQAVFSFAEDDERGKHLKSYFLVRRCGANCGPDASDANKNMTNLFNIYGEKKLDASGKITSITDYVQVGNGAKNVNFRVYGDVQIGDSKNKVKLYLNGTEITTKLASYEEELNGYKELLVELRKQNELLAEKVAILEQNQAKPLINEINKIAKEKEQKETIFSKLVSLSK